MILSLFFVHIFPTLLEVYDQFYYRHELQTFFLRCFVYYKYLRFLNREDFGIDRWAAAGILGSKFKCDKEETSNFGGGQVPRKKA